MRRVLVTGSRDFTDQRAVFTALFQELEENPDGIIIVHGDASGADHLAQKFHKTFWAVGAAQERHPADWGRDCTPDCTHAPRFRAGKRICLQAGFIRNQEMVDQGADICYAFPLKGARNRGTMDCVARAEAAEIPVVIYDEKKRPK